MNFVDEEDLPFLDGGEDAGEVELLLQHGAGGLLEADFEFLGDDAGEGGFAKAGRAVEQDVIHGLPAQAGGVNGDLQIFFEALLAGEFLQAARAQADFELLFVFVDAGGYQSG